MTTPSTSTRYTNGRLIVDEDTAFDILEMASSRRVMLLQLRADARERGDTGAASYLSSRLDRNRLLVKRLERLCDEKDWGTYDDPDLREDGAKA